MVSINELEELVRQGHAKKKIVRSTTYAKEFLNDLRCYAHSALIAGTAIGLPLGTITYCINKDFQSALMVAGVGFIGTNLIAPLAGSLDPLVDYRKRA